MDFKKIVNSVSKFFLGQSLTTSSGFWSWSTPGEWSKRDLIRQYERYVYAVVSSIAENAAKVSFEISKGDTVLKTHPFLELIKKPNPMQSQFQFLEMHFTYMKLCGESYWYLAKGDLTKKPKEIYLLRPDLVQVAVEQSGRGLVTGYVLEKPGGERLPLDIDEVVHFKMPNPANPYYGMGPVQAAKVYIETEQYSAEWTRNSIFNSGRPSGILNIKGTINDDQFQALKRQYKEQYSGTTNAGKTMFLKGADGIDYQKLGMELGEVALKELKDMSRDDIMVMFRLSKTILGITDDVNRANAEEARGVFIENIIKPELDRLTDHISAFLLPVWGEGNVLGYEDPAMISDADRLTMWDKGWNRWLTTNDIREQMGLKPIPGGDSIYQSIANVPLNDKPRPAPQPAPNNGNGNNGNNNDPNQNSLKDVKKKDLGIQRIQIYVKQLFDLQEQWVSIYQRDINTEFDKQLKEILANNPKKAGEFAEWTFDTQASGARLMGSFIPLDAELMRAAAELSLGLADDSETNFRIDERIKQAIHDRIDLLAKTINDDTIRQLEETIAEGVLAGENLDKLRNRVKDVYSFASDVRAERIARSESIFASNAGAEEAYRQSPVVTGKEWSAEPTDACEFCLELDGKIVGIDEDYFKQGDEVVVGEGDNAHSYKVDYDNIGFPPLHPNCRCSLLPVRLE